MSRLYNENNQDSLSVTVQEWIEYVSSENCHSDALIRYRLLTEMELDQYKENRELYPLMRSIHEYKENSLRASLFTTQQRDSVRMREGLFPGDAFDSLTRSIAKERLALPDLTAEEKWLYLFYSGETEGSLRRLRGEEFAGTKIRKAYELYGRHLEENYEYHLVFGQSMWMPIGNLSTLGSHQSFSAGLGVIGNGFLMRFDYSIRFGNSKNLYSIRDGANLLVTDHFAMRSGSFLVGQRIWRRKKNGLFAFVGAGQDRLEFRGGESNKIGSFNGNVGLWYQLFLGKYSGSFFGFTLAYNVVGFDSKGGTDLSGNAITWGIRIGSTGATYRPDRHTALRQIEFYD